MGSPVALSGSLDRLERNQANFAERARFNTRCVTIGASYLNRAWASTKAVRCLFGRACRRAGTIPRAGVFSGNALEDGMPPRPYWKGYLKLSLVTCPVSLTPATSGRDKLRFHTVNAETGNRVRSRYADSVTGEPVPDEDEVKGYEIEPDRHIVIEDEELEAVGLESTRTIDIDRFVPADSIEWIWHDTPYYLLPDDEVGQEAFAVIREAMAATDKVGISRLVLSRRERAVMLEPRGKGIILWTLRYGDEVREAEAILGEADGKKPEPKLVSLVQKLIGDLTKPWDESMVCDPVQENLKDIIASKRKKRKPKSGATRKSDEPQETTDNVVNIMDALKKSISQEKKKSR